jgi:hypothetical protein
VFQTLSISTLNIHCLESHPLPPPLPALRHTPCSPPHPLPPPHLRAAAHARIRALLCTDAATRLCACLCEQLLRRRPSRSSAPAPTTAGPRYATQHSVMQMPFLSFRRSPEVQFMYAPPQLCQCPLRPPVVLSCRCRPSASQLDE